MEIVRTDVSNIDVITLFSDHDDFMLDFLGDDKRYYTRYQPEENLSAVWVAYCDSTPAGCVAYREKSAGTGEVKRMFVRQEFRGQGISKRLLSTVEDHAKQQGCNKLFLDTRITLEPAVSLYHSVGFRITYQNGLYVQMEKEI